MNGEIKLETPTLISAIVQDVQMAKIGGIENQRMVDEPDYKEIEIIPVPQVRMNDQQNRTLDVNDPGDSGKPTTETNVAVEVGGMDLDKVEDINSPNLPQRKIGVASLETEFKREQTSPTMLISQDSPSVGIQVPGTSLSVIRELSLPDSKPAEVDVCGVEAKPELIEEVEERRFASLWSPGVVEDQPVVYMPPPVVETECVEELEELANVGRKERQVGSSHHLSSHHHHHDDMKKHLRELPLDSEPVRHSSDDKKTHDEVSSHKLDHRSAGDSHEGPSRNLFRVPSILEQMVEEEPAEVAENRGLFRVPSVLEQMMDEPPVEPADNVPPSPGVDEYRLDSAEFVSDKHDGSSHSHHALHMPGSAMAAVTTCRDLHFRDSEVGFILGDTEVAPAADCNSSFSHASEGENSNEENGTEFPLDEEDKADRNDSRPSQEDKGESNDRHIVSLSNGGNEDSVVSNEKHVIETLVGTKETTYEKNDEAMINEIPQISEELSKQDKNVLFFIGDHNEDTPEYSEPLYSGEENLDNNFFSEGQPEKPAENLNNAKESLNEANIGREEGEQSLDVAEPKIPTLNELFNNDEGEPDFADDVVDDYWALEEPSDYPDTRDHGDLETSEDSHQGDELLRPKPPPGRSERGCISAR